MLEISVASSAKTSKAFDFLIFLTRLLFITSESYIAIFLTTKGNIVLKFFKSSSVKDSSSNNRELNFERSRSSFDSQFITEKSFSYTAFVSLLMVLPV